MLSSSGYYVGCRTARWASQPALHVWTANHHGVGTHGLIQIEVVDDCSPSFLPSAPTHDERLDAHQMVAPNAEAKLIELREEALGQASQQPSSNQLGRSRG